MTRNTMKTYLPQTTSRNHFCVGGALPLPLDRQRIILFFAIFVLASTQAVPARMLSSGSNKSVGTSSSQSSPSISGHNNGQVPLTASVPEEELELENLKGSSNKGSLTNKLDPSSAPTPGASSSPTVKPLAYVKKPENEETPALSDNANSLKYGGANADIEEALANMVHIPTSKPPSLSVKSSGGFGSFPFGDTVKRTRSTSSSYASGGHGGLLSRSGTNLEVDYTPQDIAEYIFWNKDERGVELALNDFVQEGLISTQDAVRFLEDVKDELNMLKNRYDSTLALGGRTGSLPRDWDVTNSHDDRGFWEVPLRSVSKKQSYYGNPSNPSSYMTGSNQYYMPSSSTFASLELPYYPSSKSAPSSFRSYNKVTKDTIPVGNPAMATNSIEDMIDYEEIIDKLRQADAEMREVVLQRIIYQLARELFSMGLVQSSGNSVPAFTKFIENLSANGNISKDLERSVLENLVQALVDAANEQGLLNAKSSQSSSPMENQLSSLAGAVGKSGLDSATPKPVLNKKKRV